MNDSGSSGRSSSACGESDPAGCNRSDGCWLIQAAARSPAWPPPPPPPVRLEDNDADIIVVVVVVVATNTNEDELLAVWFGLTFGSLDECSFSFLTDCDITPDAAGRLAVLSWFLLL